MLNYSFYEEEKYRSLSKSPSRILRDFCEMEQNIESKLREKGIVMMDHHLSVLKMVGCGLLLQRGGRSRKQVQCDIAEMVLETMEINCYHFVNE